MGEHIPIHRAWVLIQEPSALSPIEAEHLEKCDDCKEFFQSFVSVAHYIGLSADFPTQHKTPDRERVDAEHRPNEHISAHMPNSLSQQERIPQSRDV